MNTPIEKNNDTWKVGSREFTSRLLVGTGKYASLDETREAITESGAEIVTVAIRRTNIGQNAGEASLLDYISPSQFTYLPNSAGCYTAKDAVRILRLGRELLERVAEDVKEIGKIENMPKMEGRQMIMMIGPLPQK